jgi:hypothetical protein
MLTWDKSNESNDGPLSHYQIIRSDCAVIPFDPSKTPAALVMQALGSMRGANRKLASTNLIDLTKQGSLLTKSQTDKLNGFFSASKASLRNAP